MKVEGMDGGGHKKSFGPFKEWVTLLDPSIPSIPSILSTLSK